MCRIAALQRFSCNLILAAVIRAQEAGAREDFLPNGRHA